LGLGASGGITNPYSLQPLQMSLCGFKGLKYTKWYTEVDIFLKIAVLKKKAMISRTHSRPSRANDKGNL
jgi:hypothetical protein